MKFLVLAIIVFSLYLIYRLSFPRQDEKSQENEIPSKKSSDGYEAVIKSRFVLPDQSNSAQHDDRKQVSDKQDKKPDIFAAGNDKPDASVVPSEDLDEAFAEDVNPEELDIEPDDNETDNDNELDTDEEAEEIRQSAGKIEGYADGFTYDELAKVIHDADKQPDEMTRAVLETLRDFAQTEMFGEFVSSGADRAARIASILDRSEQSIAQDEEAQDDNDTEYQDFDISRFLS
ncbi:MAG: hypothetical protein LBH32_08530 [Dysgonamonadaceae bacterium]|jgi:hypothetical protein|nr:hypothetical protein [Dysgonamonadaceae bacterium]